MTTILLVAEVMLPEEVSQKRWPQGETFRRLHLTMTTILLLAVMMPEEVSQKR